MKAFSFLLNNDREEKPRNSGLTMVLDKGLGLETAESLMKISGEHVDYLKLVLVVYVQQIIILVL